MISTEISTDERPPRPVWRQLFRTTEGRILLLGIAVALAGLIAMGLVAYWSPQTSEMIGAMSFTNLVFGTVVSMSIGYAAGYGHAIVVTVNMWEETVMVRKETQVIHWRSPICVLDRTGLRRQAISKFHFNNIKSL